MIIINAVGVWNVIIARTFFMSSIPQELLDAAIMDGCSDFRFFRSIVLPLSSAIIAVLMAILMPTLQKARRQAKAVVCMSKLRQWAFCFGMYTDCCFSCF